MGISVKILFVRDWEDRGAILGSRSKRLGNAALDHPTSFLSLYFRCVPLLSLSVNPARGHAGSILQTMQLCRLFLLLDGIS